MKKRTATTDLATGTSVPRHKELDDIPNPRKTAVIDTRRASAKWVKGRPQVQNQYWDPQYAATKRAGPKVTRVVDLTNKADIQWLNRMQKMADENSGPQIIMSRSGHQVIGDHWYCVVDTQDIYYQQIIAQPPGEPKK